MDISPKDTWNFCPSGFYPLGLLSMQWQVDLLQRRSSMSYAFLLILVYNTEYPVLYGFATNETIVTKNVFSCVHRTSITSNDKHVAVEEQACYIFPKILLMLRIFPTKLSSFSLMQVHFVL